MIPDRPAPPRPPSPGNVVPFPTQPPPSVQQPPWPGSRLDEGQLLVNALLALWWGYGWSPAVPPTGVAPANTRSGWMGFDPTRRFPRWGMPDALLALIAFLLGGIVFALPALLFTRNLGVINIVGLAGSWVVVIAFLAFVSRVKGQGSFARDYGLRFSWLDLPIGLGVAIGTLVLSAIVRFAVASLFDAPMTSNSEAIFEGQDNRVGVVVLAVMAAVGAPIVEELLFRGLMLRSIAKRFGTVAGVAVSGIVFGLLHWQSADDLGSSLSLVAGLATYGVTFALAARWTGRLASPILAHLLLNTLAASVMVYEAFTGSSIG